MHYEEFEWRLFRSGCLSDRMKREMSDHLRSCESCLKSYLDSMERRANIAKNKTAFWHKLKNRSYLPVLKMHGWKTAAAAALLFLAVIAFTPQGKVVLAQVGNSLAEIGHTLTEWLGLPKGSPYVTEIDQFVSQESSVREMEGIDVKLDQVLVEDHNISFSVLVGGELPEGTQWVRLYETIEIDGQPSSSAGGTSMRLDEDPGVIQYLMTHNIKESLLGTDPLHVKIYWKQMDLSGPGFTERLSGNWSFDFELDPAGITADTRLFSLSERIDLGKTRYEIDQLQISPVRQRFVVRKYQLDENGNILPESGPVGEGNLAGFLLQTEDGGQAAFKIANVSSDEKGVVLFYEPAASQFDMLDQSGSWEVIPYVSRREFTPNDTEFNGYSPLEDGAFRIENIKSHSAEH